MIKFPITENKKEFELSYGFYYLYFSGGFSLENLDQLEIQLLNTKTSETITLKEKLLKPREIINGEKVICCFEFQINNFALYKLKIKNPEILVMKNSALISVNLIQKLLSKSNFGWENINVIIK
ncbi:hypothetical protein [Flavobacterium caeni]|uniref:hypothetical protein n=1 Tax=Flavobacterium caeni TaxID=490189 RepID=UPI000B87558B|nr:hypothetical protein [Flavobacterium caeni]